MVPRAQGVQRWRAEGCRKSTERTDMAALAKVAAEMPYGLTAVCPSAAAKVAAQSAR